MGISVVSRGGAAELEEQHEVYVRLSPIPLSFETDQSMTDT